MDKKKILLVSLGHLSCDINGGALPAILPFLRAAYDLSYQATGGLMFAYACLSSMIQPLFGLLSDRFSKPWFIPLGVLLAGCGLAAIGWMPGYWGIFAAIGLSGVGAALFHPEGARFANAVSGQNKGTGMSLFSIGGNGGFVLGPLLATACLGAFGLPGTTIFAVLAVLTAGTLVWSIARMGATKKTAAAGGKTAPATGAEGETPGENNWREFLKLTVSIVTRSITFVGFNTFIPLYWVSAFGQSTATGAMALTFFCVCGVISNFFGGMLADKFGYRAVIRVVFALMPPVVAGFSLSSNLYAAWALLPLLGFVLYAPFSAQVVLGQQYLAKNIGFASGITLGLATSLGGVVAPLLGWIADHYGMAATFQSLAALSIVGAVFAYLLKPVTVKKGK
ncbi:MFS transporter [Desulfovibrio sp.]|uniref:MFS transporter n=1 Tax=Desulfovibrio sp. TaxID=885 RepID=UPI0035AE5F16